LRTIGTTDGDAEAQRHYALQAGLLSSALEHATPEQMFDDPNDAVTPDAISAVKALQKANAQGQRIYRITPANSSAALGNLHHDSATLAEIENALHAGREVITHTDAVSVPGWSGAGYVILDPETGDGAFQISGGKNGAFLLAGISHGVGVGLTLFFIDAALSDKALPYAVAALGILAEEVAILILTYTYYQNAYGPEAAACYLAGIGLGLIAANVTSKMITRVGGLTTGSSVVGFLTDALGLALAMRDVTAIPKCID